MDIRTIQEAAAYTGGGIAATNPIWMEYFGLGFQYTLAVGGLVVIILTIRSKLLTIKIQKNTIQDHYNKGNKGNDTN